MTWDPTLSPLSRSAVKLLYEDRDSMMTSSYLIQRRRHYTANAWSKLIDGLIDSKTLYIGNLSFSTREEQIYEYFRLIDRVESVIMGLNKQSRKPCGFAFVRFCHTPAINQSVNHNQSINQNQSIDNSQSINQSTNNNQSVNDNQSVNQSINPPANQSINQSISHPQSFVNNQSTKWCKRWLSHTLMDDRLIDIDFDQEFAHGRQFGRSSDGGQIRDDHRGHFDAGRGGLNAIQTEKLKRKEMFEKQKTFYRSNNQAINQSINQSIDQNEPASAQQKISYKAAREARKALNQSTNQSNSIDESINQSDDAIGFPVQAAAPNAVVVDAGYGFSDQED